MKNFLKFSACFLGFGVFLLFFGCSNGINPGSGNNSEPANTHVFVFGNYEDPPGTPTNSNLNHSKWFAYYWEDGNKNPLLANGAGGISVHDVAVVGNTRYEAGEYWSYDNSDIEYGDEACYWVNEGGCKVICEGCAIAITATSSNNVFVLGHDYKRNPDGNYPYWYCNVNTPDSQTKLTLPIGDSLNPKYPPRAIAINGAHIYIVGSYTQPNGEFKACYWDNGAFTPLPSDGQARAYDVAVQDNKVYITGQAIDNGNGWNACYWENTGGEWQPLIDLTNISDTGNIIEAGRADVVTIANSQLYIGGSYSSTGQNKKACYWDPQGATTSPIPPHDFSPAVQGDAFIHAIAVSGSTVYAAGEYYTDASQEDGPGNICYWIGNKLQSLGDMVTEICGITVVTQ